MSEACLQVLRPFPILERFGAVAYRLELPLDSRVHPVFHVSQLKPFVPSYTPIFSELPKVPDLTTTPLKPIAIQERRMVKKGNAAIPQIKVQWHGVPAEHATW